MDETTGEELRYLADRQQIEEHVSRYAHSVDRHDVALMERIYHPDGFDEHGDFRGGIDAFTDWVNTLHEGKTIAHTHNITTHYAEVDGDVAHGDSYVLFVLSLRASERVMIGSGRYIDRFERRDGRWKIACRVTLTESRIEVPRVTAGALYDGAPMGKWSRDDPSFALIAAQERNDVAPPAGGDPVPYLRGRRAIRDLVMQSARGLDRKDESLFFGQFAPEAVIDGLSASAWLSRQEAEGFFDNLSQTHNVTSQTVSGEGDRAMAETYVIRMVRMNDHRSVYLAGLRLLDHLARVAGKWMITDRRIVSDWDFTGDGSLFETDDGYRHGRRDFQDESYMRPLAA